MTFALFIVTIVGTYLRPFELFAPELTPFRPMLVLLSLSLVMSIVQASTQGIIAARGVHFGLLGMLLLAIAVSRAANGWAGGAIPAVGEVAPTILLMVLCFLNLTTLRRLQITCGAIAISVTVLAGLSVYSFHTGYRAAELVLKQSPTDPEAVDYATPVDEGTVPAHDDSGRWFYRTRGVGFLNDPNDFAQAIVMILPLLWWAARTAGRVRQLALAGTATFLFYAIHLTHSRGAWLGVGGLVALASQRLLGTWKTVMLGMVALAAVGAVSIGGRSVSAGEESAAQRVDAWYAGWMMLRSQPLFGVGFGNFTDHHELTAHNSFVLCFAELGLFGYFAWMGLIVVAVMDLNRTASLSFPDGAHRSAAIAIRASLVGFLCCAWFLSRTYQPGLYVLLALAVSAAMAAERSVTGPAAPSLPYRSWPRRTLAAMAASIVAVYAFIVL